MRIEGGAQEEIERKGSREGAAIREGKERGHVIVRIDWGDGDTVPEAEGATRNRPVKQAPHARWTDSRTGE